MMFIISRPMVVVFITVTTVLRLTQSVKLLVILRLHMIVLQVTKAKMTLFLWESIRELLRVTSMLRPQSLLARLPSMVVLLKAS